ncbi:MAG TPA: GNAT family N-acetyltransferase, partial [Gemmatimonadales bacterium]|nr:GNAT family N-acetyltransferase [Gemmatimonadales bacterium]
MATTYRLLGPGDLDRLVQLLIEWHQREGRSFDGANARRHLARLLGDSRAGHAWIIEQNAVPAGYAVLTFSRAATGLQPRAYLTGLYLIPELRGWGIGRRTERFVREVGAWLRVPVHSFETA